MSPRSKVIVAAAAAGVAPLLLATVARAQAAYTGGNYFQNFDGLPSSGSQVTLSGANAYYLNSSPFTSPTLAGVQVSRNAVSGNVLFNFNNGSLTTGSVYSYGTTGASDRALGSVCSNTNPGGVNAASWYYGIVLTNNTGGTLTDFTLTYDGEQWRDGGNATPVVQSLLFSYNVGATSIADAGFTPVSSLNFASPHNATTAAALDGNAAGNRTAGISASIAGLSWPDGGTLVLRWGDNSDANNDHGLAIDNVTFSATGSTFAPRSLTFTGGQSQDFDNSHLNFDGGAGPVAYAENATGTFGDSVTFTGNSPGTVNIQAGGASPASVTVSSDADYTFTGGPLKGTVGIQKSGAGTLVLASPNTFSGGATGIDISGGTVEIQDAGALGTSGVVLSGGKVKFDLSMTVGNLSARNDAGGTVEVAGGATVTVNASSGGTSTDPFALTKAGDGTLLFPTAFPDSAFLLNITGGALRLNQSSGTENIFVSPDWANSAAGDLVIGGPFRVNLKSNFGGSQVGAPGSAGHIVLAAPSLGASSSQLTSIQANTGSSIDLNVGVVLGGSSADDKFAIGAGSGAGGFLHLYAPVTGTGSLYFASQKNSSSSVNYIGGGTGIIELHAASTYAGDTYVALLAGGTVRSFVDDALPAATTLHFGDDNLPATFGTNSFSVGAFDLNGQRLTVSGVKSNADPAVAIDGLRNSGGPAATLRLVGGNATAYAGPISDDIDVVGDASFTGTQSLTGAITTTGSIAASGGKIIVAPSSFGSHFPTLGASSGAGQVIGIVNSALSSSDFTQAGNNELIVRSGQSEADVDALVSAWYQGGTMAGTTGLGSSTAGTTGRDQYAALAVISNSDGQGNPLFASFFDVPVSGTDVLVKYTYLGDTDLNGTVDSSDLANLLAGKNGGLTGWVNGDVNYDGVVDDADLDLLMSALRNQTAPFGNGSGTTGAVPEPSAALLAAIAAPLLGRRRR